MTEECPRILFVCSQSGARSRFAEAYARQLLGDGAFVECAGFQPGGFGPLIARIMEEDGLQFPLEAPPTVFTKFTGEQDYDYVVFLCDSAAVDLCELFQNDVDALFNEGEVLVRWNVPPFSDLAGSEDERLAGARVIRDGIRANVARLVDQIRAGRVEEAFYWNC